MCLESYKVYLELRMAVAHGDVRMCREPYEYPI